MTTTMTTTHPHVRTRSCTQPKQEPDCEMNKLTNHELSKLISSRPYKSRSQRPCDFCRKRKTCCILEGGIPCLNCKKLNGGNCSFNDGPIKRVYKRKRRSRLKKTKPNAAPKLVTIKKSATAHPSPVATRDTAAVPPSVPKSPVAINPAVGKPALKTVASSSSISSASYSLSDPTDQKPSLLADTANFLALEQNIAAKVHSSYVLTTLNLDSFYREESPTLFDEPFFSAVERQFPRDCKTVPIRAETFFDDMTLEPEPAKKLDNLADFSIQDTLFNEDFDESIMHAWGDY